MVDLKELKTELVSCMNSKTYNFESSNDDDEKELDEKIDDLMGRIEDAKVRATRGFVSPEESEEVINKLEEKLNKLLDSKKEG